MKSIIGCLLALFVLFAMSREAAAQFQFAGPESTAADASLLAGVPVKLRHALFFCKSHSDVHELLSKPDNQSFIKLRAEKYSDGSCTAIQVPEFTFKKAVAVFTKDGTPFCEMEIEITLGDGTIKRAYTYRQVQSKILYDRCHSRDI